jgi:hypothetical protein
LEVDCRVRNNSKIPASGVLCFEFVIEVSWHFEIMVLWDVALRIVVQIQMSGGTYCYTLKMEAA